MRDLTAEEMDCVSGGDYGEDIAYGYDQSTGNFSISDVEQFGGGALTGTLSFNGSGITNLSGSFNNNNSTESFDWNTQNGTLTGSYSHTFDNGWTEKFTVSPSNGGSFSVNYSFSF